MSAPDGATIRQRSTVVYGAVMAVLCEAISIIVPVTALEERFPGGLAGYAQAVVNRTFCCDGSVARVGFMAPPDAKRWVAVLISHGLHFAGPQGYLDIAAVDQMRGLLAPCDWLSTAHEGAMRIAWLTGEEPDQTFVPDGWTRQSHDAIRYLPQAELDSLETSDEGKVTKVRDPLSGETLYQGRVVD